jgi:hypothetical protein
MPMPHPGDTFPQLTLSIPGARAIQVPGSSDREFGACLVANGNLPEDPVRHS